MLAHGVSALLHDTATHSPDILSRAMSRCPCREDVVLVTTPNGVPINPAHVTPTALVRQPDGSTDKVTFATDEDGNTHVQVTRDESSHSVTSVNGDKVSMDETSTDNTNVHGSWPVEADEHVRELIADATQAREARENMRANHRNLNRMLTLFGALFIGLFVTWALTTPGVIPMRFHFLAPYAFVITILMDSGLALYGYIRHY